MNPRHKPRTIKLLREFESQFGSTAPASLEEASDRLFAREILARDQLVYDIVELADAAGVLCRRREIP